jgi:two-component system chemotaxis response regulator CheB
LAVPLVYRNELLGVLNVESEQLNAYSENDEEMLGTLGGSLAAIIANGQVKRAYFGISVQPLLHSYPGESGILVSDVLPGAPASAAGVKSGDIITKIGESSVYCRYQEQIPAYNRLVAGLPIGQPVTLTVLREGKEETLRLTPTVRPNAWDKPREIKQWGLCITNLTEQDKLDMKLGSTDGVLVYSVSPSGAAGTAKPPLSESDVVTHLNGKQVKNAEDFIKETAELMSKPLPVNALVTFSREGEKLVVIGASAGGPKALSEIMPMFPRETPAAIVIVQHMPGVFTRSFASRLNSISSLPVKEAEEGDEVRPGTVLVAPGGNDLIIGLGDEGPARVELMESMNRGGATPRIDTTMITAAETYGEDAIGVIMTGMGSDGAKGMERIKKGKGSTIAQDEDSCLVFGMPKVAIERGCVDWVMPLEKIPGKILELL